MHTSMSCALQTCCSEHDIWMRQLPDLSERSASEMFVTNILYSVSSAFTHNHKYSRQTGTSEHAHYRIFSQSVLRTGDCSVHTYFGIWVCQNFLFCFFTIYLCLVHTFGLTSMGVLWVWVNMSLGASLYFLVCSSAQVGEHQRKLV